MTKQAGSWNSLQDWPLIGLHAIVTQDGKVLTFGTDSRGMQGGQFIYDLYDPVTNTHTTLDNKTATDIFCSAAIIIPGTNDVLIGGGDARPEGYVNRGVNHVNIFDNDDMSLTPADEGLMNYARWYPTMVSLATGQVVILGGSDGKPGGNQGQGIPEIFTPGEGWRALPGGNDADVAKSSSYPRAWVNKDGEVVYFATGRGVDSEFEVMALDPSGDGSLRQIGSVPFTIAWDAPAIMYETGKILVQAANGDLWTMDINGPSPVFARSESLSQDRNWSNMTVLADGSVLINGGTANGNLESTADKTAAIWNPDTGRITYGADEDQPRLYHSASVLLADGTVLSLGGGSAGMAENNYLDGQVYKPPYLFDDNGNLATRPVITDAPDALVPGQTFTITLDDTSAIEKLTFVKNGATTHGFNMEARMMDLDFKVVDGNKLEVTLPENANEVTAGSWMLFAWNDEGVPSKAPIIAVDPSLPVYDGIGDLRAEYFTIDASVTSLDQIDFDATAVHTERVSEINENSAGAYYPGGPANDFAVRYTGEFLVSEGGSHTFYLTSDDGARLYIDGKLVVDNNGMQAATLKTGVVELSAGMHEIKVEYFEGGGPGSIDLDWSGPGFSRKQMTFDGAEENLILNGSFERGIVDPGKVGYFDNASMPGWSSDANRIEVQDRLSAQEAGSGTQWAEIDYAGAVDNLYQDVQTEKGQTYRLSLDAARRPDAPAASNTIEVYWNGSLVATVDPASTAWSTHQFSVTGTGGKDRLEFREPASANNGAGSLIDSVVLTAAGKPVDPDPDYNVITAAPEGGYLQGTDGKDKFVGGAGLDVFYGGKGDDLYQGGVGYNQVDFDGAAADYTFTRNADGTITAVHPVYGTDTLQDIGGVWFSGENKWYDIEDLLTYTPGEVNVIEASAEGGYLRGTSGDDEFRGGEGTDVFYGGKGNDVYKGAGGYNQVDYDGAATDYTFTRNPDGSVTATHPDYGADTLKDIGGLWFSGENKWYSIDDLIATEPGGINVITADAAGGYLQGTDGNDKFIGGDGVDVFYGGKGDDIYEGGKEYNQVDFDGAAADYTFTRNDDGSITVTHPVYGTDTLKDIAGTWFSGENKWYPLADLITPVPGESNVITASSEGGYLRGTAGDDEFRGAGGDDVFYGGKGDDTYDGAGGDYNQVDLDGSRSDYTFTRNDDGTVTAASAEYGRDVLKDIDGIWFYGEEVWTSVDDIA